MTRARLIVGAAILVAACGEPPVTPTPLLNAVQSSAAMQSGSTYVIIGTGESLPADLAGAVTAAGGTLESSYSAIGVAIARAESGDFAVRLSGTQGIESVVADTSIQWIEPGVPDADAVDATVASLGDDETFYSFQWAPGAVQAPEAWNAGYTGRGVRVAILDGAIYSAHRDLSPNLDVGASRSFVPGQPYNNDGGTFWHGTHVAGIVAAADNTIGTVGIAPNATLIGVKVLHNGSGQFGWIISGIMYAATPLAEGGGGANIINMSLGATFADEKDKDDKAGIRLLKEAIDRATKYAHQRGTTVIASAGNGGINLDAEKFVWKTPAMNQYVISVASTGPINWARGGTNFASPAYYTDHGKTLVDVAAPGGTAGLIVVNGDASSCTVVGTFRTITRSCFVFDMVMSTVRGTSTASYGWAQGTSMAAPLVSGIAALIIERNGGSMHPDQVRARLQQSATDLGKPGQDVFYGHGWVNAYRAIQ